MVTDRPFGVNARGAMLPSGLSPHGRDLEAPLSPRLPWVVDGLPRAMRGYGSALQFRIAKRGFARPGYRGADE